MTERYPMLPPAADSVHAFPRQPVTRPPTTGTPLSESLTGAEGPSADVIAFRPRAKALTPRQLRREGKPALPPPATETAANARMRAARRDAWWFAHREADYWLARADWSDQLRSAQERGIGDSASFPKEATSRIALLDIWREKLAQLLVLPAPDRAAVEWKQAKLRNLRCIPIKRERVERAIADDLAFLAAHPTRRNDPEKLAARRAFKEALRQRIRDVATELGLSDAQIKPALSLRHQAVGEFLTEHRVSGGWLFEESGPMFR